MLSPLKGELRRRIPLIVSMGIGVAMIVHLGWALRAPVPARPSTSAPETGIAPPVDFLALALRAPLLDGTESNTIGGTAYGTGSAAARREHRLGRTLGHH